MIGYSINGTVYELPTAIDVDRLHSIELISTSPITVDNDSIIVTSIDNNVYRLDFANVTDSISIVLANVDSQYTVALHKEHVRTDYLKQWLTNQQMSFIIPILEKVGWDKLKEAALKAKQIMDMQGAEQALSMMLNLLDADQNVELYRYWELNGALAYDDMRAMDLAFLGYVLTNKLKLVYKQDKLNPWSSTIEATIQSMVLSLQEVAICIKHVLPATLEISDYQLLKLGLGLVKSAYMTMQSSLQISEVEVVGDIGISNVIQYSYENFIYDLETKELIRIANASEANSQGEYLAVLQLHSEQPVYNVTVDIDNVRYIECDVLQDNKAYVLAPPVGRHTMAYAFSSESGNRHSKTIQLIVLKSAGRQDIYALCEPNDNGHLIEAANISAVFVKWRDMSYACNGRPIAFDYFKTYQQYFIPISDRLIVRINDGISKRLIYNIRKGAFSYAFSKAFNIGGNSGVHNDLFTMSVVKLHANGTEQANDFFCLTSKSYMSMFELTVEYYDNGRWNKAMQLGQIYSDTVQPHWTANTIAKAIAMIDSPATAKITINGKPCFNGGFMPVQSLNGDFCRRLSLAENIRCNQSFDNGDLLSVSTVADSANFVIDNGIASFAINDVRRPASFGVEPVGECYDSVPYIVYRPNTYIEVLSNDNVAFSGYGLVVFAKTTSNKYKVHLYNDWYDKTIEI